MSWLTCWAVFSGWLICLPAPSHENAVYQSHASHTWENLYTSPNTPPQILHITPERAYDR